MAEDMQSDEQGMDAKMDPTALVREDVISDVYKRQLLKRP